MRGRSYTPSPPRGYGRRGRSPSPRGRYGSRASRDAPTSLLVRNLRRDCRPDDLRRPFGQFGQLKDVYLPRDYYTGSHRGRVYERRRSPLYSRSPRYSRSPPSRYARPHTRDYSPSPERREHSRRSISPPRKSLRRERSFSHTPTRHSRSVSRSPVRGNQSPPYDATSPVREHSPARAESRSRSPRDRSVDPLGGDSGEELNGR